MIDYYETKSQPITRQMVWQAYQRLKSNKGSFGVDQMDWVTLDRDLKFHLYKLWNRLSSGSYFPQPVREVSIKKKLGGVRKLGIPTLLDRIAQEVARTHLERYADDIVVHCKTERQANFLLNQIKLRLSQCKLSVHDAKTKIVNIRGASKNRYNMSFDFLGFMIQPHYTKVKGNVRKILPRSIISKRSVSSVLERFKCIHKRRVSVEKLARELNPIISGVMNYYCKFWTYHTHELWSQLNKRLQKWVKWEKRLYKLASVQWLKKKYVMRPDLFAHWKLVRP